MIQIYVLPHSDGWAVVTYGDPICPDDEIVPLPLTSSVSYADAVRFVEALPMAAGAMVDGWPTLADLELLEPTLAERVAL